MHRTEGSGNVDGLYTQGPPATTVTADSMNALQEEIVSVIQAAGLTLKTAGADTYDQLAEAIGRSSQVNKVAASYILTNATANPALADGVPEIIDFDSKVFDGPGADRVTTGASWKFTAERAMIIRVSCNVILDARVWAQASFKLLLAVINPIAGTFSYNIGFDYCDTAALNKPAAANGTRLISLEQGATMYVLGFQSSGGAANIKDLDGAAITTYIDIEEI